eukprot:SM000210S06759  [mRNA]  locus=s210:167575:172125:- [translate_table: standard]
MPALPLMPVGVRQRHARARVNDQGMMSGRHVLLINPLNSVLNILIQLTKLLDVFLRRLPIAPPIGLEECLDQLPERVRIGIQQSLLHLLILDECCICLFIDPIVNLRIASQQIEVPRASQSPEHLHNHSKAYPRTTWDSASLCEHLISQSQPDYGPAPQQHMCMSSHSSSPDLSISDKDGGSNAEKLGCQETQFKLARVEACLSICCRCISNVLECGICCGQGHLKYVPLLAHAHAWGVRIEGERFARQIHHLELLLVVPRGVLYGEVDIRGVRSGCVGVHPCGRLSHAHAQGCCLLHSVLTDEVHAYWLIELSYHLHCPVTENARAIYYNINPGPAKLLQRDRLNLVDPAQSIWKSAADVGIACGSNAWIFLPVGRTLGLRMGSPPGPGSTYPPSNACINPPSSLSATICSNLERHKAFADLLEAECKELKESTKLVFITIPKLCGRESLDPRLLPAQPKEATQLVCYIHNLAGTCTSLHTCVHGDVDKSLWANLPLLVGSLLNKRLNSCPACLSDVSKKSHICQHSFVVAPIHVLNASPH